MLDKRATIREVAELAGVSHQTVSRFLRNRDGLKPATLARVQAAVAELNYRPNLTARSMRAKRTGRIAILLPISIPHLPSQLLGAASASAQAAGFSIDILGLEGDAAQRADRVTELADSRAYEGILALAALGPQPGAGLPTPVVTVADYDDALRGQGELADGSACGTVVRLLADLGHTRFLHLAGPRDFASARNRRRVFLETVAELDAEGAVIDGDWSAEFGYAAVAGLDDDHGATAIVAANDRVAMGAIRACLERSWAVPGDVSVFGWDDEDLCRYATPSLSTVAIDREREGREAMERLIATIRGTEPAPAASTSRHTVIPRESIGAARTRP